MTLALNMDMKTRQGATEAFPDGLTIESLIHEYKGLVFNTCLNFLNIKEDAEEITQDVFVEVYKSLQTFRGEAHIKTWIYRIAISKCLELIRKQKRKKRFVHLLSIDSDSGKHLTADNFDHPGIEDKDKSNALIVLKEVEKLPEKQRIAFTMHHMDGLSYKEISEIMELSLSAIESLLFRAKQNLKKRLLKN